MTPQEQQSAITHRTRPTLRLNTKLDKNLLAYAAAASAAGVGMLALAQPAEGKIVYTPAHVLIPSRPPSSYQLDVNHDRVKDFFFANTFQSTRSGGDAYLVCGPLLNGNHVWGHEYLASALPAGVRVGPHGPFNSVDQRMAFVGQTPLHMVFQGPWANKGKGVKNRYLGLKFVINGKIHYGWARLNVSVTVHGALNITATLTGYAYETVPGRPIITGKTDDLDEVSPVPSALASPRGAQVTLGLLAAGSRGVSVSRLKEPTPTN